MCGMKLVEVVTPADYEAAFNDRTGMAFFFNAAEGGQIERQQWVDIAHAHGVPCFLDAAADVPPISNFWNYTKMGFDLVTFSGGTGFTSTPRPRLFAPCQSGISHWGIPISRTT